jgi:competence protein ComEC
MNKKEIILIFILLIIGLIRFFFFIPKQPIYTEIIGKEVIFEGIVINNPDIRLYNQHLIVKPINQKTNILVITQKEMIVNYGDKVRIEGIVNAPENFITESGREFNYKRYLANQDIYLIINKPSLSIISHNHGNKIKSKLYFIRNLFIENIEKSISRPMSDLASGLILGARGGFDNEMNQKFIETGTIHIVALSGYNISIIADNILKLFSLFLSQIFSILFAIIFIVLFILMTGATPTAIRAGLMAGIVLFAKITGRNYDAGRALIIAGLLMITYDLRIITDMSFQLSFLATAGILFITPLAMKYLYFLPNKYKIRETVATTIGATIAVLPLILYLTGVFSIVSILANVLIIPFIPITMFFSFLTSLSNIILPILSLPFMYLAEFLLSYILFIVDHLSSFFLASFTIPSFPLLLSIIIYLLIFYYIRKMYNN